MIRLGGSVDGGVGASRSAADPLWIWIACSILLHTAVAAWLWDSRTRIPVPEQASSARVAVRLVAPPSPATPRAAAPSTGGPAAPSETDPPPIAPAAPLETDPPPITPTAPARPTPAAPRPEAPSEPLPTVPTPAPAETAPPPAPSESEAVPPSPARSVAEPAPATAPPNVAAAPAEASSAEPIEDLLARYVAEVRGEIDAEKSYPAFARRRGEEGTVLARVVIEATGRLERIEVMGDAPLLLRRATRQAVERAAPFPVPPDGGLTIEVPVRWRMRD